MRPHESEACESGPHQVALVTGGTGAVGPVVVQQLLRAGYQVRMLVWGETPPGMIPDEATPFAGDINDRDVLRKALRGTDVVFHLAAKLHINNPTPSLQKEYHRVNVEGTRCLAEMAAEAAVKRFVHFSTINVYGSSTYPNVFDETSPLNCESWYAETKCESERIALDRTPATVLRMAAVYGPRMKGNYARLLAVLRAGRYLPIGPGHNRRTLVYQEDVAEAAILAATHPQAIGQTYNVSDGQIHTVGEIVGAMCRALDRREPIARLPIAPAKACASIVDLGLRCLGRQPFARNAVNKFIEDMAVSAEKIREELHFLPRYDLERGWCTMVSEFTQ